MHEQLPIMQTINQHLRVGQNMYLLIIKLSKGAKIRNRYNQVQHLTQDTNGKVIMEGDCTHNPEAVLFCK